MGRTFQGGTFQCGISCSEIGLFTLYGQGPALKEFEYSVGGTWKLDIPGGGA